jgi:hypothetical protein
LFHPVCASTLRSPRFFETAQSGIIAFRRLLRMSCGFAPRGSFWDDAVFSRENFFFVRVA